MISKLKMSNVMGFETFENPFPFPQVTVILGKNDTCKTALLKMIYSVGKAKELYIKQTVHHPDISFKNIISKKLFDVYTPKRAGLSDIVRKNGTPKKLSIELNFKEEDSKVNFSFGVDTRTTITDVTIRPFLFSKCQYILRIPTLYTVSPFTVSDTTLLFATPVVSTDT